ncbi:PQQ-like beta-propeller repeat protein [Streptomyces rubrisoli]|uniref:PQQ-like beta-propeller repeat protein n=2 Tax=Streptantibioticus rubrisoli TaxID=1387313 RepID=A0ABT1PA57_9ACTN|nr:PQQ-like beta-propeller repeat protein [Streptantibioticus rubrisoli]
MWFSGDDVVKQTPTGVTAYDLASGQQHWTVPSPEGGTCDAANDIVNNKVAVQYGTHCENLMVVDASTGKLAWNKPLGFPDGTLTDYTDMAISGDVVAVTADQRTVSFQASTGKPLWHSNDGSDAHDKGFAGGSQMVEVYYNGGDQEKNNHVSLIDPMTGKPKWTWDAPAGTEVVSVISVNPVVVGIGAGNTLITDVWDVDGGRLAGKVSLGGGGSEGKYAIHCPANQMTPCNNVVVSGNTLYMATSEHSGSSAGTTNNEIAAFDLSSGSSKWLSKSADAPMQLVSADGNSVIAYQKSSFEKAGKVIKVDPSSGALSTYTTFDDSTAQQEGDLDSAGLDDSDFGWHNNILAISVSQVYSGNTEKYLVGALH